jgi:membrane protease subunit HflK
MAWNPPGQKPGKPAPPPASGDEGNGSSPDGNSNNGNSNSGNNSGNHGGGDRNGNDNAGRGNNPGRGAGNAPRPYKSGHKPTGYRPNRDPDDDDNRAALDDVLEKLNLILGPGPGYIRMIVLALLALVFIYGGLGLYEVQDGEQALVQRNGRVHEVNGPGLHWNPPGLDTWRIVNVKALREATLSTEVIARDEDLVAITLTLRYRIADLRDWLLRIEDADAELLRAAESVLQAQAARLSAAELRGPAQRQLAAVVEQAVATHLRAQRSGLALVGVSLERVTTPAALNEAVNAVSAARADIATQVQRARADAEAVQKKAQADARARIAAAQAARDQALQEARRQAARLRSAIDSARTDPQGTRQRLYEETVADVLARTPTVIVGEEGLERLDVPAEKLKTPSPLPPSPGPARRPPLPREPATARPPSPPAQPGGGAR